MSETPRFGLPLVQPAQAQKHVTVNEALGLIDAAMQLSLNSQSQTLPPAAPVDGDAYLVPAGAVNAWAGRSGEIAIASGGGWVFVFPRLGWSAWIADTSERVFFDGLTWQSGMVARSQNGASTYMKVLEFDQVIGAGASQLTDGMIPAKAMVLGVTARVITAITGTLSSWTMGVEGSETRFGSGLGIGAGSYAEGILSMPTTHYSAEAIKLSATGGDFAGGELRVAVHYIALSTPSV